MVDGDRGQPEAPAGEGAERVQGLADRAAVRPDQSARAELDAAVVAGDDGDDVPHVAAQQHLEHGDAGGAAGFAVVARLLDSRVGADDVRVAVVVASACSLRTRAMKSWASCLGGRRGERAEEAGAVDLGLVHARAGDRAVLVLHPASLCAAPVTAGQRPVPVARGARGGPP